MITHAIRTRSELEKQRNIQAQQHKTQAEQEETEKETKEGPIVHPMEQQERQFRVVRMPHGSGEEEEQTKEEEGFVI